MQLHIKRYAKVMNDYNAATGEFKANLQGRLVRQLKIVDKTKSPEEIEQLVESGHAQDIIKKVRFGFPRVRVCGWVCLCVCVLGRSTR